MHAIKRMSREKKAPFSFSVHQYAFTQSPEIGTLFLNMPAIHACRTGSLVHAVDAASRNHLSEPLNGYPLIFRLRTKRRTRLLYQKGLNQLYDAPDTPRDKTRIGKDRI